MIYKQLKKNFMGHCALAAILLASLTGCQKVALEESGYEEPTSQEGAFTILFDVGNSLQTNFSLVMQRLRMQKAEPSHGRHLLANFATTST